MTDQKTRQNDTIVIRPTARQPANSCDESRIFLNLLSLKFAVFEKRVTDGRTKLLKGVFHN